MEEWKIKAIVGGGTFVLDALYRSLTVRRIDFHHLYKLYDEKRPYIFAFWHNRLLMACYCYDGPFLQHVFISQHGDGEIIARICNTFGFDTIRGSTTRGGSAALKKSVRILRKGGAVGVTPDGPKGPRMRAQGGVVSLAQMSGAPIVPMTFASSHKWIASSWDRFQIPQPGATCVFRVSAPIEVPRRLSPEEHELYRLRIEKAITDNTRVADALVEEIP